MAIFSDTHGNMTSMRQALGALGPFDAVIHLGDGVTDGLTVARERGLPFHGVAGNEDWGTGLAETSQVTIAGWRIFLIHGHQTEINPYQSKEHWLDNLNELVELARSNQAQILIFGHTHVPLLETHGSTVMCNPGTHHLGASQPHSMVIGDFDDTSLQLTVMEKVDEKNWRMVSELDLGRL